MRIAVLGSGDVGRTIAGGLSDAGHEVLIGSRSPRDGVVDYLTAVDGAEVVVNALLFDGATEVFDSLGENITASLVIDASNALDFSGPVPRHAFTDGSFAQRLQARLGADTAVVKAFNLVPAARMAPASATADADLPPIQNFIAGDDGPGLDLALSLLAEIGWREDTLVVSRSLAWAEVLERAVLLMVATSTATGLPTDGIHVPTRAAD